MAGPTTRFRWNFGDGTAVQTTVGNNIRTHVFTDVGTYTVTVEMRDASDRVLGRATSQVTVRAVDRWQLTSFSQTAMTNRFSANHQATLAVWERAKSSNELRDSMLARPGGATLQLMASGSTHPVGYRHADEEFEVYRATMSNASPAMFLTYARGSQQLAEAVAAAAPGFAQLPPQSYPFLFANTYQRTTSGNVTYSGTAANWVSRKSTLTDASCDGPPGQTGGAPYSAPRSFLAIEATGTPTGLSGTITFVTQFAAIVLQATPTVCWWQPMAEIRRTFASTAVPLP